MIKCVHVGQFLETNRLQNFVLRAQFRAVTDAHSFQPPEAERAAEPSAMPKVCVCFVDYKVYQGIRQTASQWIGSMECFSERNAEKLFEKETWCQGWEQSQMQRR